MTARTDVLAILQRNRRRMDAERRAFAEACVAALRGVQPREGAAFDQFAYMRATMALRPIFDEFYGAFPGDRRARFWRLIVEECRSARGLAFQRAVQDVRARLRAHPDLMRAIREAA